MELILIKSYKHLSIYEKEWKAILEENENKNPFIEYEYVYNWWMSFVDEINIEIHAVKENNRIIAFFPFQLNKKWFVYKVQFLPLRVLNSIDIIAKRRDVDRVIMFALDALIKQKKSAVFYLDGLVESGDSPVKLSNYLKSRNMKEQSTRILPINIDLQNLANPSTRKIIFSTNTFGAKTYRNYLWVKETINSKVIGRLKT